MDPVDRVPPNSVETAGTAPSVERVPVFRAAQQTLARLLGRVPDAVRVWCLTATLAIAAAVLFVLFLARHAAPDQPLAVPWPLMAVIFFVTEFKVVDVHWRREKHSFSLSEFPAVISFFLLSPGDYLLAMLLGNTVAILLDRQPPIKLAFNIAMWSITAVASLTVFYALTVPIGLPGIGGWGAAFAGTAIAAVLQAGAIAAAISMSGGAPQFEKLPEMVQFGVLVAVANTSLALLAVSVMWVQPLLLALLAVPLLTVYLAYRAYVSERERHQRLELLYQSSRILQHSPELDSALAALLDYAREMQLRTAS
jgi:MFS family permease